MCDDRGRREGQSSVDKPRACRRFGAARRAVRLIDECAGIDTPREPGAASGWGAAVGGGGL